MDQEKFSSVSQQPSSNSNLSRDAAETLKLIQKKGLSISVVKSNSGPTPPTHTDNRSKQCQLSVDKAPKMTPVIPRTQTVTENKVQNTPTRLISTADTRVLASGRATTMASFLEGKPSTNQARPNQPSVSEGKVFNQNWNPSSSADKTQATISRPVVTTPVVKMQTSQVRTPTTDKNSIIRNNQMMHAENKSQARVAQVQRVAMNQQLIEGKIQNNQDRVNMNNSSDFKNFSNQSRTGQFPVSQENKATSIPRVAPQKAAEAKTINPLSGNKSADSKSPQVNRMGQNVKVIPDPNQNKPRPNFIPKLEGKPLGNSPMIVEKKMVKQVTNVVDGNSTQTTQCKSSSTQVRVHPSGLEAATAVQTKMICTTAVHTTKMIVVQNVQNVPDAKMFLQGAKVTSQTASDMIQKTATVFDMSSESSVHGTPITSRVSTAKRSATVVTAPVKKKCLKQTPPSASDINNKSMEGPSISLPEDENANEAQFLNNLSSRTSRTGLTITPIRPTTSTAPSNSTTVTQEVRKTAESIEKSIYKNVENAWMKSMKTTKAKGRGRGRKRFTEPVCLTLSSDEDEEGLHPINNFHSELSQQMYPQDSDDSNESESKYNEENPESDQHWFPGVTDMNDHLFMQNQDMEDPQFPGVMGINENSQPEQYEGEDEDEEGEPEEEEEEEEEEKVDDEMEEEEEMGDEEMEMEESDMDEEEEVPPEEEEEQCMNNSRPTEFNNRPSEFNNRPTDNKAVLSPPLLCRSVRVGSYKIHAKGNNQIMSVYLGMDGISFNAPMVSDVNKMVNVILKPTDVTHMLVHFGKCLPILFIFTTQEFAEAVRKSLDMSSPDFPYYDPLSNDEKEKKITFLIDTVTDEQRNFLRHKFLCDQKIQELDQKMANEILVKSTPSQNQYVKCEVVHKPSSLQQHTIQPQIVPLTRENVLALTALQKQTGKCEVVSKVQPQQPTTQAQIVPITRENVLAITALQPTLAVKIIPAPPPQPAIKLLTYPPPPQTGGVAITNEDLYCLNEGEFLNDQIIDFYLKYVFYEKLPDYHREKTHMFSSYFYHRLTNKPDARPRARPGDELPKTSLQVKRHAQVKTWTRHVDIFSKDFIIIPINQNVHWLLAIICYPSLVPEAAESPVKQEVAKLNKSSDNVTSTDDQEENKTSKEPNSTVDGNNQNSDENSTTSSNSMYEAEEPDSEEPIPEAPDSSTHPDKTRRKKEVPCICVFDSLRGPNRGKIVTMLREYLEVEWKTKKGTRKIFDKTTMQGYIMQCPQQTNYSDCGIYLLQYVESFFENPLPYFDSPIPNLTNWFPKEKVASKRQELKDLIISLQKKYSASTSNASEDAPTQSQVVQTDNR